MAVSSIHNGWRYDPANNRLDYYYRGTRIGHINATGLFTATPLDVTGAIAGSSTIVAASDTRTTSGNVRLGTVSTFATTQPVSAAVFKTGTAPVGAITTSGAIYSNGTVVLKIIADGTASNVET